MSENDQLAFHERMIRGINLRVIICMAGFLITTVYYSTQFLDKLQAQIDETKELRKDFRTISSKVDTLSHRQELNNISNDMRFREIDHRLKP